jgi:hypothetical protein
MKSGVTERTGISKLSFSTFLSFLYILAILIYLSIALNSPVSIWLTAGHDDGLFINNAMSIVNSGWLGPYNQYVLAKGPGFPLFLALNSLLGTSITLLLGLVFISAALALSNTLNRIGTPPLASFVVFCLVIANSSLIPTRVIRDNLYISLTIFVVVLGIELFLVSEDRRRKLIVFVGLGFILGVFFLTREEFVWVFPFFITLAVISVWSAPGAYLKIATLKPLVAVVIGFSAPILSIATINLTHYGVFQTNDFTQGSFPSAIGKLQSVASTQGAIPYVPVPGKVRELVYGSSPKFSELRGGLEDSLLWWQSTGCEIYPKTCGDYAGGWFQWAFRDAVAQNGYYSNGMLSNNYFQELNQEIEEACTTGVLTCDLGQSSLIPRITRSDSMRILDSFYKTVAYTFNQNALFNSAASTGTPESLGTASEFLGFPRHTPLDMSETISVTGWYKLDGWISTNCPDSGEEIEIYRQPSSDVADANKNPNQGMSRFSVEVTNLLNCSLVEHSKSNKFIESTPWLRIIEDTSLAKNLHIESVQVNNPGLVFEDSERVKQNMGDLQAAIINVLFPMALVSHLFLAITVLRKPKASTYARKSTFIVWAITVLIGTRIVLISVIDGTSFPGINVLYLGPAIVLIPVLCVLPLAALWGFLVEWYRLKRIPREPVGESDSSASKT